MSTELVTLSNHLILCRPRFLLPSIFPNNRFFSNELALCIRWPKYWSFSFSISPSKEYSGLISFMLSHFSHVRLFATLLGLQPTRLLYLWDSPGKNTRVGCHFLLQGIFPAQGSNPYLFHLLHWQEGSLPLAPYGNDLISLLSKGLSRVFSSTTVQKHQFFGAQPSLWSNSQICTLYISLHLPNSNAQSIPPFSPWQPEVCSRVERFLTVLFEGIV